MDITLLFVINRQWTSPFIDWLMAVLTNFDLWRPVLFILIPLLLWRGGFRWRTFILVTLVTLGVADGIFTQVTKHLVDRPRPMQALADVREVALARTHPTVLRAFRAPEVVLSPVPSEEIVGRSFPSRPALNNPVLPTLALLLSVRLGDLFCRPPASLSPSR